MSHRARLMPLTRAACPGDPNPQPGGTRPETCSVLGHARRQQTPLSLLTSPVKALCAFCHFSSGPTSTAASSRHGVCTINRLLADGGSDVEECAIPGPSLFLGCILGGDPAPLLVLKQPQGRQGPRVCRPPK